MIKDEKVPRRLWKLGKIERLHYGDDGEIRSCKNDSPGECADVSKPQYAGRAESTLTRKLPMRLAAEIAKQRITQAFENICPDLFVVL